MTDLLSSLDKSNIHKMFDDIHDTFAREIKIYKLEDEAIIDTDDSHNPLYGNNNNYVKKEYKIYVKKARIKYQENQERGILGTDSQLNITYPRGTIRLKVDEETYKIITESKKIQIDDRLCELISSPSRPGPFNPNYWTIYLKQLD
jgi:hypothetical protein